MMLWQAGTLESWLLRDEPDTGNAASAGSTGFLGQQPLDGKRDLSVRGHVDDLDFDRIAIVQDGCNVLHKLIGHLGNMDHAHAALRQRNKCAKRLHACDTTLENVSYLNCQSSILLFFS